MEGVNIFKGDQRTIDTQKVCFAIWNNRKNGSFIRFFTEMLCTFVEEKRVFNEIEFYLPQLAHLIIHLEEDWTFRSLEKFALLLSQTSMHTALQLCFMLTAAMEDYQPENAKCEKNPDANPQYFFRCASLLRNIEWMVVFGTVCTTGEMMDMMASLSPAELVEMVEFEKTARLNRILNSTGTGIPSKVSNGTGSSGVKSSSSPSLAGNLLYKKDKRTSMFASKGWELFYFKLENRVLLCYDDERSCAQQLAPVRAIPLSECELFTVKREKYDFQFELVNNATSSKYQFRANSQTEFDRWIGAIRKESSRPPEYPLIVPLGETTASTSSDSAMPPRPPLESSSSSSSSSMIASAVISRNSNGSSSSSSSTPGRPSIAHMIELSSEMTPNQRKRFTYFQQQRTFVKKLAEICEKLRFLEKEVRGQFLKKDLAELVVPPFCYLPLCRSVDPWKHVLRCLPNECHAFSTKARCPALILFEMEESTASNGPITDVATFLATDLHEYSEEELTGLTADGLPLQQAAVLRPPVNGSSGNGGNSAGGGGSRTTPVRRGLSVWKPQGTGLLRLTPDYSQSMKIPAQTHLNNEAMKIEYELKAGIAPNINNNNNNSSNISSNEKNDGKKVDLMGGKETFTEKAKRLRGLSPYGHLAGWQLDGLIAKSNDDLRQEQFVMQLIIYYQIAFQAARVPVWLYTYRILSTSKSTGLIQLIPDAISLDGLKKRPDYPGSLRMHFEKSYGFTSSGGESPALQAAIKEYVRSLAGYSIVSYLLDIKDRHNGNVMIDSAGHLIHIDFGFVFGLAPGKQFSMEKAPWKLTEEWVEVMGGPDSTYYREYIDLCVDALRVARTHAEPITWLMEIMTYQSNYPAFKYNPHAIRDFKKKMLLKTPDADLKAAVEKLVEKSYKHTGTGLYDSFQLATNGIAK